jgi:lipid-binding SYLF domain-containing protein
VRQRTVVSIRCKGDLSAPGLADNPIVTNVRVMRHLFRSRSTPSAIALVVAGLAGGLVSGCERPSYEGPPPQTAKTVVTPEQRIVDEATAALASLRLGPQGPAFAASLETARGIMIFPKVTRAAFLLGGGGGNGVLLAKDEGGHWSPPAFYSLGGGSAGLQVGFERATIVLVFMNDRALKSAIDTGLTLGADASVAAGTMGEASQANAVTSASDIYEFVDAEGVYAGASVQGMVVTSRTAKDRDYYGRADATAHGIVLEHRFESRGAQGLMREVSRAS